MSEMLIEKKNRLNDALAFLKGKKVIKTQKDVAGLMFMNVNTVSQALKGNSKYLTDSFLKKFAFTFKSINEAWLLNGSGTIDNKGDAALAYNNLALSELTKEHISIVRDALLMHEDQLLEDEVIKKWLEYKLLLKEHEVLKRVEETQKNET